jgi:hypothetical protein
MNRRTDQSPEAVYERMQKGWEYIRKRHFAHKHPHGKKVKKAMMKEASCTG